MEEISPRSSRARSWWLLGAALLLLLLLTIGAGLWWYRDDSDLTAVRAEAQKRGIPSAWEDSGLVLADAERIALWNRIAGLVKILGSYQDKFGYKYNAPKFALFLPLPDDLVAYHAGLDAQRIEELMGLLDQLGDQPLILHRVLNFDTSLPEITVARGLLRFLHERIAIAAVSEVPLLSRRALALCRSYSGTGRLIQHLFHVSIVEGALGAITSRLKDLQQTDPNIADAVLATTQDLPAEFIPALKGQFLCLLATFSERRADSALSEYSRANWYIPLVVRYGRRDVLIRQLDAIDHLQHLDLTGALVWTQAYGAAFEHANSWIPNPIHLLHQLSDPPYGMIITMAQRTSLRGRLLAAELRGQPWPEDVFDPTHHPLRRIERDSKIMGAYSVGSDGIDAGGKADDRYFPLYGPRELPKPAP